MLYGRDNALAIVPGFKSSESEWKIYDRFYLLRSTYLCTPELSFHRDIVLGFLDLREGGH